MNNTAYDYWIYQQLEPTDIIRTGNHKRHKPIISQFNEPEQQENISRITTEEEKDKWNEENEKRLGL